MEGGGDRDTGDEDERGDGEFTQAKMKIQILKMQRKKVGERERRENSCIQCLRKKKH